MPGRTGSYVDKCPSSERAPGGDRVHGAGHQAGTEKEVDDPLLVESEFNIKMC